MINELQNDIKKLKDGGEEATGVTNASRVKSIETPSLDGARGYAAAKSGNHSKKVAKS